MVKLPKYKSLEDYDEELTRVWYENIEQMKHHHKTVETEVFKNRKKKTVYHILRKDRE